MDEKPKPFAARGIPLSDRKPLLEYAMTTWGDAVCRLALSQTRSRADAEDVYRDAFLRPFLDATAFESDAHMKAWLLRVTVNRCRDLARTRARRKTVPLEDGRDVADESGFEHEEYAVWEAVGKPPENHRAALHLHYVEGYSTDEIARILRCRPATARTWLFRARSKIRDTLEETENEQRPRPPGNAPSPKAGTPLPSDPLLSESQNRRHLC